MPIVVGKRMFKRLFRKEPVMMRGQELAKRHDGSDRAGWLGLETLEPRLLLSTINWINEGAFWDDTDNFNQAFEDDAPAARAVVNEVIDTWEEAIVNFNRTDGTNRFELTILTEDLGSTK